MHDIKILFITFIALTRLTIGVNPQGLGVATPDFGVGGLWGSWGLLEILLYTIT